MADDLYRDAGLTVDFRSCRVWVDDEEIQTSAIRFRILSQLIENAGRPLSAGEIMHYVWYGEDYDLGLVRWHIAKLRKELGDVPPKRIVHVRGFGYRFDAVDAEPTGAPQGPLPETDQSLLRTLAAKPVRRCYSSSVDAPRRAVKLRYIRCLR